MISYPGTIFNNYFEIGIYKKLLEPENFRRDFYYGNKQGMYYDNTFVVVIVADFIFEKGKAARTPSLISISAWVFMRTPVYHTVNPPIDFKDMIKKREINRERSFL